MCACVYVCVCVCVCLCVCVSVTIITAKYLVYICVEIKVALSFPCHFLHMHCVDLVKKHFVQKLWRHLLWLDLAQHWAIAALAAAAYYRFATVSAVCRGFCTRVLY